MLLVNFHIGVLIEPIESTLDEIDGNNHALVEIKSLLQLMVSDYIKSEVPIMDFAKGHFGTLLKLRKVAVDFFLNQGYTWMQIHKLTKNQFQEIPHSEKYSRLINNIDFALHTNFKYAMYLAEGDLPNVNYEIVCDIDGNPNSFIERLFKSSSLSPDESQLIIKSLCVEFSAIVTYYILKKDIVLSDLKLDELEHFIINSTHAFIGHAMMIKPRNNTYPAYSNYFPSENELNEAKFLANLGLKDLRNL